jgi:lipoic acid synthetase
VAQAARELGLRHVVLTSVTRDDLPDGGAAHFAAAIRALRAACPDATVEVLTPDFGGLRSALSAVFDAGPDVFNHNLETVRRLQACVRPQASYERSLEVLAAAAARRPAMRVKSGLMLGMGEEAEERREAMRDLRAAGCELLTLGQYLAPGADYWPVAEYVAPADFARLAQEGRAMGFAEVAAGPRVRSSYLAEELYRAATGETKAGAGG